MSNKRSNSEYKQNELEKNKNYIKNLRQNEDH